MAENNKPAKTYKLGALSLSLWENETKDGTMMNFTFQRAYKDTEDNWQHTQQLRTSDLPKLRVLVEEAYKDMLLSEIE